jgi:hypothetical protein
MNNRKTHWLKLLFILPLIVAFSFTSVATAQDNQQQTGQTDEIFSRHFASVGERQQARQRDLTAFDNPAERARWCDHDSWVVREGESLGLIALRCDITLSHLLAVNPQISSPDLVYVGEVVDLPDHNQRRAEIDTPGAPLRLTTAQRDYMQGTFAAVGEGIPITGQDGEDIGRRNMAAERDRQMARQRDLTRFDEAGYREQWCNADHWVVSSGESMSTIIRHCGYNLEAILAANPQISNPDILFAGELVRLPGPEAQQNFNLTQAQRDYINQNFAGSPDNDG